MIAQTRNRLENEVAPANSRCVRVSRVGCHSQDRQSDLAVLAVLTPVGGLGIDTSPFRVTNPANRGGAKMPPNRHTGTLAVLGGATAKMTVAVERRESVCDPSTPPNASGRALPICSCGSRIRRTRPPPEHRVTAARTRPTHPEVPMPAVTDPIPVRALN